MKLTSLDAQLLRVTAPGKFQHVDGLAEAQGVTFICPKCQTHSVGVWFRNRGVPDSEVPGPGRWAVSGTSLADLTLTPSINLNGPGCGWHGFVSQGEAK